MLLEAGKASEAATIVSGVVQDCDSEDSTVIGAARYAHGCLGNALVELERADDVEVEFRKVLTIYEPGIREKELRIDCRVGLAKVAALRGEYERARYEHGVALDDLVSLFGPDHPYTWEIRFEIAVLYWLMGNRSQSVSEHRNVASALARLLGDEHPATVRGRRALAAAEAGPGTTTERRDGAPD